MKGPSVSLRACKVTRWKFTVLPSASFLIFSQTYVYLAGLFATLSAAQATSNERRNYRTLLNKELLRVLDETTAEWLGYHLRVCLEILHEFYEIQDPVDMRTEDMRKTSHTRKMVFRLKAATLSEQIILISAFCCDIMQRLVVIPYRQFGTTYRSHRQG